MWYSPLLRVIPDMQSRFRWVSCQLDSLRKCRSPAALEKSLRSLPKTLYETYDRILKDIDDDDRRDALRILQWLSFSVRAISLQEAVEVLATDPEAETGSQFNPRRRLRDPLAIVTICPSLVIVTENGRFPEPRELRLTHFSVREYLTSDRLSSADVTLSFFYFSKRLADTVIAQIRLVYLLQFDQDGSVNRRTTETHPLSPYAARYWMTHAQPDNDGSSDTLYQLILDLFQSKKAIYSNWLRLYMRENYLPATTLFR